MLLIADSGASKTDWLLKSQSEEIFTFSTIGLHPLFVNQKIVSEEILANFPKDLNKDKVTTIYFYGAGCAAQNNKQMIKEVLEKLFKNAFCFVEHDILGAARALLRHQKGIAVILGTGSNSCLYNGTDIVLEQTSLGYILGDEGSGADIGKNLVKDWLYGVLPKDLEIALAKYCAYQKDEIINKIYHQPFPNKFLASFTKFVHQYISHEYCQNLVKNSFEQFLKQHILKYPDVLNLPIVFTGSVAFYFQKELKTVFEAYQLKVENIIQKPIKNLLTYHTSN